ncbi:ABC transporter permease [Persephonella sp.]|uniref:ABC transporter permease n=1 Tax=Persephonella sp. TaxID=2060922 RepID=UPI0025E2EB4A|nr:ABC transporter permease [Persephonella sp.]
MPLYIKIALKYLLSLRSKALSFMTVISFIGITVGVSALLITLAVMSGFQWGLKEKILETSPHIVIFKMTGSFTEYKSLYEYFVSIKDIQGYQPFIYSQALASKGVNVKSVNIRGVDPEKDKNIMKVNQKLIAGNYEDLKKKNHVLIGKDVAVFLDVWVGDSFKIMSPFGRKTPLGYLPKIKKVYVAGIVDFGMYEYDSTYIQMKIDEAQKFFDMKGAVTGIQLKLKDPYKADIVKKQLEEYISYPYIIRTWMDLNKSLFQALQLEKLAMFLVIALIVLVASFNVSSLLITKAREKRKDIAILKTIGADSGFILKTFLWQGMLIGISGTVFGTLLGFTVIYFADTYQLVKLDPEVYMIEYLPLKTSIFDIGAVFISSISICFISSILPAYFASKDIPAEVLRYE